MVAKSQEYMLALVVESVRRVEVAGGACDGLLGIGLTAMNVSKPLFLCDENAIHLRDALNEIYPNDVRLVEGQDG